MFKTEVLIEDSMEMDIDVKTSHLAERQFTLQLFTKFTKEVNIDIIYIFYFITCTYILKI